MKYVRILFTIVAILIVLPVVADAAVIGGINYADDVAVYSSNIQNYGGTMMDTLTEFWLTGAPDADTDGNGYAWDSGEPDYLGGWRSNARPSISTVCSTKTCISSKSPALRTDSTPACFSTPSAARLCPSREQLSCCRPPG